MMFGLSMIVFMFVAFGISEVGVIIKNVDIAIGEVAVNLNEELFVKNKSSADNSTHTDKVTGSTVNSGTSDEQPKKKALSSLSKYTSMFPEKVSMDYCEI